MFRWIEKNRKTLVILGVVSIAIPLLFVTYKVAMTQENAVTLSFNWHPILIYFMVGYYVLLATILMGFAVHWLLQQIKFIITVKNEKAKTELIHLKTQVTPHFFFNMLNNLYSLIDVDSEKAKRLILKLSDMMRYSIYEGQKDKVTIQEEKAFIENFIALHQMRYHKHIEISFTTEISNDQIKVMPLLCIILVENAFKHGVEVLREDAYVRIELKADARRISCMVENNFDPTHETTSGIGLINLKRRLQLGYPKRHHFTTSVTNTIFKAALTINTNE